MRNLKRVLSLALALVMMLGMMVIGANAASTDFADADEIKYTEAVDVMAALSVLEGDGTNYYPTDILNREQAATIVCKMLMGPENAKKLVGSNVYTDVAANRWSAGYISYCDSLGILAGNGDGTFNPTGELTGVAFAKMLLVALGYDPTIEGYVNNKNWATNIGTDAIEAGLNIQGVDLANPVTREQAAQMAFQALTATMVKYASKGTSITIDGIDIVTGASSAEPVTITGEAGNNYAGATGDGVGTQQFCEKYFKTLKKDTTTKVADDFGRPGYTWEVDNTVENDVFVAAEPFAVYTKNMDTVAGKKAMTATFKGYTLDLAKGDNYVDGKAETGTATDPSATVVTVVDAGSDDGINNLTSDTAVVEVYVDKTTKEITNIVKINTYAATVATFTPYNAQTEAKAYITLTGVSDLTKIETDKFAKDDVVLYTKAYNTTATKYDVVTMEKAKSFTGTLTSWTKDSKYTIGSGVYAVSGAPVSGFNTSAVEAKYGKDMVWYVGNDGKLIYVTTPAGEAPVVIKDYLVVMDCDLKMTADAFAGTKTVTAKVKAVLADGTSAVYDLPLVKLAADDATHTLDKGDYVLYVGETPIEIIDKDATSITTEATTLKNALGCATQNQPSKVFTYTVNGTALTLASDLTAFTGAESASGVVLGTNSAAAVTKASVSITDVTDKTIIANTNTVFVLKTATGYVVKTGVAALENTSIDTNKALIVTDVTKGTSANTNVATVVFAVQTTFTGATATSTKDLIYVDGNYTVTYKADGVTKVYTYTGVKADGTKISVTGSSSVAEGIYKVKTDNSIGDTVATTEYTVGLIAGTTADVNGYKTVNDTTKIVVVAEGASFVTGAKVFYDDTNSDGVIDLIYVTEKAAN